MWPITADMPGLWLALYLLTWALHAVFVGYVVAGTAYALVVRRGALVEQIRDRLPFMLGCGITAGVGPLLFLQLLHQRRFYTANLLLGPRWMLVVPALIAGFYALYLAKANAKWRQRALVVGLGAFAFVAYSWSELHELMAADPVWRDFYAAGSRVYWSATVPLRTVMYLGGAASLFGTVSLWSTQDDRRRLVGIVVGGIAVAGIAGGVLAAHADGDVTANGWLWIAIAGAVVGAGGWLWSLRAPGSNAVAQVATGGVTAALVAAAVVREAPRVALIEPSAGAASGGVVLFAVTFAFGIAAIAWIVRTIRA